VRVVETAPAKINLALHVTGKRADGYHLLSSLVVFCGVGDRVLVEPADALSLTITGPMAAGLAAEEDNLVLRAARLFGAGKGAAITLEKHLPVSSGIGGGSADAAAALRALARLWECPLPGPEAVLSLGADVPVCLAGAPSVMEGIGERLTPVPALPELHLVLVNPGVPVSTAAIFRALGGRFGAALPPVPGGLSAPDLAAWLAAQRNELETPARTLEPAINRVLAALGGTEGCLLARMSGSGATCFGVYARAVDAERALHAIATGEPSWWVAAGPVQEPPGPS